MNSVTTIGWAPKSDSEKQSVSEQLRRLLSHPAFKNGKRNRSFLVYIVEHQLRGETFQLKERTIGIEVFGRAPDYDTSSDPVVRLTASEVRKRLTHYYNEQGHEKEIRVELPLRSYAAEFHLPNDAARIPALPVENIAKQRQPEVLAGARTGTRNYRKSTVLAVVLIAFAALASWRLREPPPSSMEAFWKPVLDSREPTLVCVNTWDMTSIASSNLPVGQIAVKAGMDLSELLPISDAVAFSHVAALLGDSREGYRVQGARSTTLSDLMQGPAVLIGTFGNPWTIRFTDPLRFHFTPGTPTERESIVDTKIPSKKYLVGDVSSSYGARTYGIVARVSNVSTGQVSIIAAGLNAQGTTAASEFITSPRYVDYLEQQIPRDSTTKNVEALISVEVIEGRTGAPHIEATEVW